MAWKLNSSSPIYLQLVDIIKSRIISGMYAPGDKIPSVRDLAAEAGVNPNTMQKALSELEAAGMINTNRTSGRTVTDDQSILETIRSGQAEELLQSFFKSMNGLGYSTEEIREQVRSYPERIRDTGEN